MKAGDRVRSSHIFGRAGVKSDASAESMLRTLSELGDLMSSRFGIVTQKKDEVGFYWQGVKWKRGGKGQ